MRSGSDDEGVPAGLVASASESPGDVTFQQGVRGGPERVTEADEPALVRAPDLFPGPHGALY